MRYGGTSSLVDLVPELGVDWQMSDAHGVVMNHSLTRLMLAKMVIAMTHTHVVIVTERVSRCINIVEVIIVVVLMAVSIWMPIAIVPISRFIFASYTE